MDGRIVGRTVDFDAAESDLSVVISQPLNPALEI